MSSGEAEARHVAAATAKARGSEAYAAGNYASAVRCFGEAISVAAKDDPDVHVYHSNRCAARLQVGDVEGATKDAEATTRLAPKWAKGWSRLGNCLSRDPTRVSDARRALEKAVRLGSVDARDALADLDRRHPASARALAAPAGANASAASAPAFETYARPARPGATPSSPPAPPTTPSPTPSSGSSRRSSASSRSRRQSRVRRPGPSLRPRRRTPATNARRRVRRHDAYDDDAYVSNGTLGGLGTLASLAVLYFA